MDYDKIASLADALRESPRLTFVEIRSGEATLRLRRSVAPPPQARLPVKDISALVPAPSSPPSVSRHDTSGSALVTAQLVGVFRHTRPHPFAAGDTLKEAQVLGQIESMRLMNDCLAPTGGRVHAVFVQEGQPVEFGQPLFEIISEPEAAK